MTRIRHGVSMDKQPRVRTRSVLRQRLSNAMPWALLLSVLGLGAAGIIYLPRWLDAWPIEHVKVQGVHTEVRQQQLSARLADGLGGENFFSVSLARLRHQALQMDWIENAQVSRQWPDALVLDVVEREPVAVWNDQQLISSKGVIFSAVKEYNVDKLPRLYGDQRKAVDVMNYYHSMSQALVGLNRQISRLEVDARLTARLTLDDGLEVVVDRDDFAYKLRRFSRLYQGVLAKDERKLQRVDLRYADGAAVTYAPTTVGRQQGA